jgi:5-methylcytosine-specific restriction enzyme A
VASRICSVAGCPRIHDGTTGSRCPDHAKQADRVHWARTRGYNTKAHRVTFRLAVLQKDPICVLCHLAVSTVADHYPKSREDLIQLAMNPDDPRHGRGLCEPCHNTETAANQPGGWNAHN